MYIFSFLKVIVPTSGKPNFLCGDISMHVSKYKVIRRVGYMHVIPYMSIKGISIRDLGTEK